MPHTSLQEVLSLVAAIALFGSVCLAIGVYGAIVAWRTAKSRLREFVLSRNLHAWLATPPEQGKIIREAREGLYSLSRQSQTARKLLGFFDENAIWGTVTDSDGHTIAFHTVNNLRETPRSFIVLGDMKGCDAASKGDLGSYDPYKRVVVLRTVSVNGISKGLTLAHELAHALDLESRPNLTDPIDEDMRLATESVAYLSSYHILNENTDGQWGQAIKRLRQHRQQHVGDIGKMFYSFGQHNDRDIVRVLGTDHNAASLKQLRMLVDLHIGLTAHLDEDLSPAEIETRQRQFTASFYARIGRQNQP